MRTSLDHRIEVLISKADQLGETPLWCEQSARVWWIDIERPKLQSYCLRTGTHDVIPLPGEYAGTQALARNRSRLVAKDLELELLDLETLEQRSVAVVEEGIDNRLNDGRVDPHGRFWVGTMDNGLAEPNGNLYRIDPNGTVTTMASDVIVSNGIAFAPDGRTLYFTDTRRYTSFAFDLDMDDGMITNRRVFADYTATGDRPDGASVDVDGCLWTAFFGGKRIVRYTPAGKIDRVIEMPVTNPTCLCFGGSDYKTLFVTSAAKFLSPEQRAAEPLAGALFAIHGLGQGQPENLFG